MNKIFFFSIFMLFVRRGVMAQNIYESIGKKAEILTLSNGKYQEIFPNDTLVRIGTVLFNTVTNEVVDFVTETDTTNYAAADVSSRFLSIDPIGRKYPELTPYQFASNTPIQAIDLDGLEELHYFNDQKDKYLGLRMVIKILTETGIAGEILQSFAKDNTKTDMYYNVDNLSGTTRGETRLYIGYKLKEMRKDIEMPYNEKMKTQTNSYNEMQNNNTLSTDDRHFIWERTLSLGKGAILAILDEDLIKQAGESIEKLEELALVATHEPIAHGLNRKTGYKPITLQMEHIDFHGKKAQEKADPQGELSPAFEDIDPNSKAGGYKARIEKYVKEHKAELEKMIKEEKEKQKDESSEKKH